MSLSNKQLLEIKKLDENSVELAANAEKLCLGYEAWSAEGIRQTLNTNGHYFAAFKNGQFAGHIGFTKVLDEGYITNIVVLPEFRRQGIASLLLDNAFLFAKDNGLSFLTLEVRRSNTAAIELYSKKGFKLQGQRKNFYSFPTEDAIIMTVYF